MIAVAGESAEMRERDPGDLTAAADRHDHRSGRWNVLEDLEPDGPGTVHHIPVVVRMDQVQPL